MEYTTRELKIEAKTRATYHEHSIGCFRSMPDGRLRAKCCTCGAYIDLAHHAKLDTDITGHCLTFRCPKYRPFRNDWPEAVAIVEAVDMTASTE